MSLIDDLKAAPIGAQGIDDDGDTWTKEDADLWRCDDHKYMQYTNSDVARFYTEFKLMASATKNQEVITKADLLAQIDAFMNDYGSVPGLGDYLTRQFNLKPKTKLQVTLEIEVDDVDAENHPNHSAALWIEDNMDANGYTIRSAVTKVEVKK